MLYVQYCSRCYVVFDGLSQMANTRVILVQMLCYMCNIVPDVILYLIFRPRWRIIVYGANILQIKVPTVYILNLDSKARQEYHHGYIPICIQGIQSGIHLQMVFNIVPYVMLYV